MRACEGQDLVHAQHVGEAALLRSDAEPAPDRDVARRPAEERDASGIGAAQADRDFERRRLTRAVWAEHRDDLVAPHAQRQRVERANRAVRLPDAVKGENVWFDHLVCRLQERLKLGDMSRERLPAA